MRTVVLIASLVLTAATPDRSTQQGSLADLVVEEATIDASAHEPVAVRVRNRGQGTIVAWGIKTTLTDANGVVVQSGGGTDSFEYDVVALRGSSVLRPNDTYTIRLGRGRLGFEPISVTASPEYAIFDDNSASGDERSIEMQFEHRARHAAGWQFVERAFEEALASTTAPDGVLRLVEAGIAAAPREIRDSPPCQQVSQRIRLALRPGSLENAFSLLQALSVEAGTRRKAAAARSIRRQ